MFRRFTVPRIIVQRACMLVTAFLCAVSTDNTAEAQTSIRQQAEQLLQATVAAISSDALLRIRELEQVLEQSNSVAVRCETLKEIIYLSLDAGDTQKLTRFGRMGQSLANEVGDEELKIYSELALATVDYLNGTR